MKIYTKALWDSWLEKELKHYQEYTDHAGKKKKRFLKKGYLHFDRRYWLPTEANTIEMLVSNPSKISQRSFLPFIKQIIKTPRFRYNEDKRRYHLESKKRPICFASHLDSLIYGYYSYSLSKRYEDYIHDKNFSESVIAYRSDLGKSNIQFAKEVFDEIRRRRTCDAIALDIKGYFDHIDHQLLKEKWSKVIGESLENDQYTIYRTLTKYSYVNRKSLLKHFDITLTKLDRKPSHLLQLLPGTNDSSKFRYLRQQKLLVTNDKPSKKTGRLCGIPQGSSMSALLSNIYLVDFDKCLTERSKREDFLYRRYCDDLIIICNQTQTESLLKEITEILTKEYHLIIQKKKVELIGFREFEQGKIRSINLDNTSQKLKKIPRKKALTPPYKSLQYLGFEFNGKHIRIRPSSLSHYYQRLTAKIEKTVAMAYSPTGRTNKIFTEKLFHKYTHLGKRNFIQYALNASRATYKTPSGETKEGLDSPAIRKQIARHTSILMKKLENKNMQRIVYKLSKAKSVKPKQI